MVPDAALSLEKRGHRALAQGKSPPTHPHYFTQTIQAIARHYRVRPQVTVERPQRTRWKDVFPCAVSGETEIQFRYDEWRRVYQVKRPSRA